MKNYKNKITYWQNQLNEAINSAPCDYSEENVKYALFLLTHYVNKQMEVDFPPSTVEGELERLKQFGNQNDVDEAIKGDLF